MNFIPLSEMNPVQIAIAKLVVPKNIKTIEAIIENKEFSSGTPEEWNMRLEAFKARYRELCLSSEEGQ